MEAGLLLAVQGEVVYDLDVSPDGTQLVLAHGEINGQQTLRVIPVSALLRGDATATLLFTLGTAIPSNFTFSPDGRHLYGSWSYTGVSNIFRFDLATKEMQALTNSETGFFQPTLMPDGSLLVFRYTGDGFVPSRIAAFSPLEDLAAISFLGHETVEKRPVLKTWIAGSPSAVPLETLSRGTVPYRPFSRLRLESLYPSVEGYKDTVAVGAHLRFSDPVGFNHLTFNAGFSPTGGLDDSERLHLRGEYRRYDWTARASLNDTDFYDLFGPTKSSRKGYALSLAHTNYLIFDQPKQLTFNVKGQFSGNLDRLPEFQNVAVDVTRLATLTADLSYSNVRSSLGSVDDEAGTQWSVVARGDRVNGGTFHAPARHLRPGAAAARRALVALAAWRRRPVAAGCVGPLCQLLLRGLRQQLRRLPRREALSRLLGVPGCRTERDWWAQLRQGDRRTEPAAAALLAARYARLLRLMDPAGAVRVGTGHEPRRVGSSAQGDERRHPVRPEAHRDVVDRPDGLGRRRCRLRAWP